ncbi:MaoC family dehydratase [Microbacterium trichothecenolyticum]|uniref:Bifunctional aldehyde dehydrogenase/enoyl-CoA hydratase n=1 Tax=Microbacterium trichothecenolyticum TaxID=69370 RepID=A0A0M2HDT1_MICTR|nr:MaoC family dehydratase [Microbacterium trichothecenolyticum]KJL42342.1 bifunctional aldehyde dehydrogenase/enoyl-CoA hydratase [Microbacterium trichothecenolyticum]
MQAQRREVADAPDLDSFPRVARGNKYEDFAIGQTWRHHWGRTLTQADNVGYCVATCAWLPLHLNVEYARAHGHPDTLINPMLVLSTTIGLSVEDLSESGGPFLGIDDCTFGVSVYPGDTLTAWSRVTDMRTSDSKPGVGIVTWLTTGVNQRGEQVIQFVRTNMIAARGDSTPKAEGIAHDSEPLASK